MAFATASLSSAGGRTVNEDQTGYLDTAGAGCWVVADGLGGHGGGATASRLAVDAVLQSFRANPAISSDAMRVHLAAAHTAVLRQQSEPALSQMRSTIVVLLANERTAVCGHIGDSRLYHFQAGVVDFQTIDHSVPGALAASGAIPLRRTRFGFTKTATAFCAASATKGNSILSPWSDLYVRATCSYSAPTAFGNT